MMASDGRNLATTALIPLEIDPASVLSLSKGVIFDTIVHNIECTFSNRLTEPLPWKLVGMSLICDPDRNKKYLQKLQKMQCVPSVISTHIYHSKLVKTESDKLSTPGRKIIIPTVPRKRLTGIIVCRSIDELLHMEPSTTQNVHYIQYKLLSYQRIATRELVNGPKSASVNEKLIKTVFDFELSQNNGFPRQLLPFAIISFVRQQDSDLCSSIRNFLKLDEHKNFDKTYLVTTVNSEVDRLREEQERKEDDEAEQELPWERIQRRQPLADLSKKTTDSGNARPSVVSQPVARVPPLKIDLTRIQKPLKLSVPLPPIDSKYRCLVKLDRVDLSSYDISNLSTISKEKEQRANQSAPSSDTANTMAKALTITKPLEHKKSLKRLSPTEARKQSSHSTEVSKEKNNDKPAPVPKDSSNVSFDKNNVEKQTAPSSSTSLSKRPATEKPITKKKLKRPPLPLEYSCCLKLSRIDLSMYDIVPPKIPISSTASSTSVGSGSKKSPSLSTSSSLEVEPMVTSVNQSSTENTAQTMSISENSCNLQQMMTDDAQNFEDFTINETSSATNNVIVSSSANESLSQRNNEDILTVIEDISPISSSENNEYIEPVYEPISPAEINENQLDTVTSETTEEIAASVTNEIIETIQNKDSEQPILTASSVAQIYLDEPIVISLEALHTVMNDSDGNAQECLLIVPCSDDDDDDDFYGFNNEEISKNKTNMNETKTDDNNIMESATSPTANYSSPILSNPSLAHIFNDASLGSDRSSTSPCSSLSSTVLHNRSPRTPLDLTEISIPQKVLKKKQNKSNETISFSRYNINIPLSVQEPSVDPRLIYRLQAITTDLRWPSPCRQCSASRQSSPSFHSSTQVISHKANDSADFIDPRRASLKETILNIIYERLKLLKPHLFSNDANQLETLLLEQTVFKTNCSLHLEYLLRKIKLLNEKDFFHMIQSQEEFELSSSFLQLIFI